MLPQTLSVRNFLSLRQGKAGICHISKGFFTLHVCGCVQSRWVHVNTSKGLFTDNVVRLPSVKAGTCNTSKGLLTLDVCDCVKSRRVHVILVKACSHLTFVIAFSQGGYM